MVQERIILWLPCINSDKNLANAPSFQCIQFRFGYVHRRVIKIALVRMTELIQVEGATKCWRKTKLTLAKVRKMDMTIKELTNIVIFFLRNNIVILDTIEWWKRLLCGQS